MHNYPPRYIVKKICGFGDSIKRNREKIETQISYDTHCWYIDVVYIACLCPKLVSVPQSLYCSRNLCMHYHILICCSLYTVLLSLTDTPNGGFLSNSGRPFIVPVSRGFNWYPQEYQITTYDICTTGIWYP